jgi:hypothetical protein
MIEAIIHFFPISFKIQNSTIGYKLQILTHQVDNLVPDVVKSNSTTNVERPSDPDVDRGVRKNTVHQVRERVPQLDVIKLREDFFR